MAVTIHDETCKQLVIPFRVIIVTFDPIDYLHISTLNFR